jgi:hypothetical protein
MLVRQLTDIGRILTFVCHVDGQSISQHVALIDATDMFLYHLICLMCGCVLKVSLGASRLDPGTTAALSDEVPNYGAVE